MIRLHIDIETIPSGEPLPPEKIEVPAKYTKAESILKYQNENVMTEYRKRSLDRYKARILCIGIGIEAPNTNDHHNRFSITNNENYSIGVITGIDERDVMENFNNVIMNIITSRHIHGGKIVGFNIKEFDLPIILSRGYLYKLPFVRMFPFKGKDDRIIDLMDMIDFTAYKSRISMNKACSFFGIETKGDDIDGSKVFDYVEAGKEDVVYEYCAKDILRSIMLRRALQPEYKTNSVDNTNDPTTTFKDWVKEYNF